MVSKIRLKMISPLSFFVHSVSLALILPLWAFPTFKFREGVASILFCVISFSIQFLLYKVKNLKDSQFIDWPWMKKTHKFKPDQLDAYDRIQFWIYGALKAIVVGIILIGKLNFNPFVLIIGGFVSSLIIKAILYKLGILDAPVGLIKFGPHRPPAGRELDMPLYSQGTYYMKERE